jgi:hypothetical protein
LGSDNLFFGRNFVNLNQIRELSRFFINSLKAISWTYSLFSLYPVGLCQSETFPRSHPVFAIEQKNIRLTTEGAEDAEKNQNVKTQKETVFLNYVF